MKEWAFQENICWSLPLFLIHTVASTIYIYSAKKDCGFGWVADFNFYNLIKKFIIFFIWIWFSTNWTDILFKFYVTRLMWIFANFQNWKPQVKENWSISFFFLIYWCVYWPWYFFFEQNSFERCPSNKDFGSFSYIRVVTILDVRVDLWG